MARKLQRAAEANGISMKLKAAQNQIARIFGYRNYLELKVIVATDTATNGAHHSADDYRSTAVARLAADNGWTVEFAETVVRAGHPVAETGLGSPRCNFPCGR